ncbi:type I restriction-modification systemmethyltransferase subunit [Striga asiatica]|uniref:Type I restriction-modification systemmethyltransferase subunit n=1 Tax=Striga asiatica TaxID=4170 RepID=A0A5A7R720_STRAF|nr:type I restriction-modification systemmethyltransferase subunit [Striga asiatica]
METKELPTKLLFAQLKKSRVPTNPNHARVRKIVHFQTFTKRVFKEPQGLLVLPHLCIPIYHPTPRHHVFLGHFVEHVPGITQHPAFRIHIDHRAPHVHALAEPNLHRQTVHRLTQAMIVYHRARFDHTRQNVVVGEHTFVLKHQLEMPEPVEWEFILREARDDGAPGGGRLEGGLAEDPLRRVRALELGVEVD